MPLFEYDCLDCGKTSEILVTSSEDVPQCQFCNSKKLKKVLSVPSRMSGPSKDRMPGLSDTTCCGSVPGQAAGCAGPGSCCGKTSF